MERGSARARARRQAEERRNALTSRVQWETLRLLSYGPKKLLLRTVQLTHLTHLGGAVHAYVLSAADALVAAGQ